MSATNFIDTVLERNGDYAVYGKGLGDKMRGDAVYGKDPWRYGDRASAAMVGADPGLPDRTSQIAELDRKIAELKSRISSKYGDIGDPVSRYRFVYENDASGYQNAVQGDRSHRQAKELADINHKNALELQKASQQKTDRQQAIDAWKQNSIDLEASRYTLAAAQQAYNEAKNSNNTEAIRKSGLELQRARGAYNRNVRENEALRAKAGQIIGLPEQPKESDPVLDEEMERDVQNAESFIKMQGDIERIVSKPDNISVTKAQKAKYINDTKGILDDFERNVRNSSMGQKQKNDLLELVRVKRDELAEYAKPKGKGGQGTSDPGDAKKLVESKTTRAELKKLGLATLKKAKDEGAQHRFLDAVISELGG